VNDAAKRGGALLIPAFAVGRTQEITWMLRVLEEQKKIPVLPVYVDSPMAVDVTAMYAKHSEDHDAGMRDAEAKGNPLATRQFHLVRAPEESKKLNDIRGPMIVISASGMANGGRILHHLKLRLPDPKTTVLLAGYQGVGTNGRQLQDGAATLRIYGEEVPVKAKVATLSGLSAHAGQDELLRWAQGFQRPPGQVHMVHGEPGPAAALAKLLTEKLKWNVNVAKDRETATI
jgi:metallo-beta-lactamase family protein